MVKAYVVAVADFESDWEKQLSDISSESFVVDADRMIVPTAGYVIKVQVEDVQMLEEIEQLLRDKYSIGECDVFIVA